MNPDKCKCRIRCLGGPVDWSHLPVNPISNAKIGSQHRCVQIKWTEQSAVKISVSNQIYGNKNLQPKLDHVNGTIYSKTLAYTDFFKYQRWDQVPRRSKHPLLTGHTCRSALVKIWYMGLPINCIFFIYMQI
jgi:hypothetical protein